MATKKDKSLEECWTEGTLNNDTFWAKTDKPQEDIFATRIEVNACSDMEYSVESESGIKLNMVGFWECENGYPFRPADYGKFADIERILKLASYRRGGHKICTRLNM